MKPLTQSRTGVSLLEVLVASTILVIAIISLYSVYIQSLNVLKRTTEASVAQTYLLSQLDQLRDLNWTALSGSTSWPDTILPSSSGTSNPDSITLSRLPNVVQRLTVYPVLTASTSVLTMTPYYTGTRNGSDARGALEWTTANRVTFSPAVTGTQKALTFLLRLQWSSQGRIVSREYAQVLTKPTTQ